MKKNIYVVLAAVTLVMVMAGGAYAAGVGSPKTTNVNATATVANVCKVAGSGTLAFGSLDAVTDAAGKTVNDTGTISIMCTNGASVAITDDLGANESGAQMRMNCTGVPCTPGTDYINYSITYTTPLTGTGINNEIAGGLTLSGNIPAAALDDVPAGGYSDTIVLSIAY